MHTCKVLLILTTILINSPVSGKDRIDDKFESLNIQLVLPAELSGRIQHITDLFKRQVISRCEGAKIKPGAPTVRIELNVKEGIGNEGFRIADGSNGGVRIIGNDENGLLYGVGKFLRTSYYSKDGFTPGMWRGTSIPTCPVRGIYLATHFNNFYEAAPPEKVVRYLEELSLWGLNTFTVHFPTWQYKDFNDSGAVAWLRNIKSLFHSAHQAGLQVGLGQVPNQGFSTTPDELRGVQVPGNRRGNFGVNLCVSKPESRKLLTELYNHLLNEFKEVGLDYFIFWPYDEGGCGCKDCWPWGGRGYIEISKTIEPLVKKHFPACKKVLSAWCFENEDDNNPDGEWIGLVRALDEDKSWVDYIMADGHDYYFPKYLLEKGVPGNLPLLNFPEISMWGKFPWGGFGATPLPEHFQILWNIVKGKIAGGTAYSEGIFEDINKIIYSQFYWNPEISAEETVREYIAYEYAPEVVAEVMTVIRILEQNHQKRNLVSAEQALEIIKRVDAMLPAHVRSSWRWRILYLRTVIDHEMCQPDGETKTKALKAAFDELESIYHTNAGTLPSVRPPRAGNY